MVSALEETASASVDGGSAVTAGTSGTRTYALLTDGSTVEIRPAGPQDTDAVRQMHAAMSPDNIYLRFFSISPAAAEHEAQRVSREPRPGHAALLAWLGGRLVAELDLNPVMARPDGVTAVDVRVRVSPAEPRDPFLRRRRWPGCGDAGPAAASAWPGCGVRRPGRHAEGGSAA